MWYGMMQVGIVFFGVLSLVLISKNNKWGFIHGFICEILTMVNTVINPQLGMFLLSSIQALIWVYGIYKWFILNDKTNY